MSGRYAVVMGRRRGKKSRTKNAIARSRRHPSFSSGAGNEGSVEVMADGGVGRWREMRTSKPGVFRIVFFVMICSVACLFAVVVILKTWLDIPYKDVPDVFKYLDEEAYSQGVAGAIAILGGIATIALTLRGMSWRSRELPTDSRLHRAWLQRIIDDSARESLAFFLLVLLAGLYGAVVVCYGILVRYAGWPGISRVLFIFISTMYFVVATLPVFVPKSEVGSIKGYVGVLVRLANLVEWRCCNLCDSALCEDRGKFIVFPRSRRIIRAFCLEDLERKWCRRVVRFAGLVGNALVFLVFALMVFMESRSTNQEVPLSLIVYILIGCLIPESLLAWCLKLKCQVASAVKTRFDVAPEVICFLLISASAWMLQLYIAPKFALKILVVILFLWWFLRVVLAVTLNPEGRKRRLSGLRRCMEIGVGLRCIVGVWIDEELPENVKSAISYFDENLQVADELSVAASLIIPERYVVTRIRNNEEVELVNLRKHLSEVVKVTLPPAPKP